MKQNNLLKLLTKKNFLKIWLVQLFSLISATTLIFVLIGRVFSHTQSTMAVGFLLFFYYLPTLILGPFVGVFIDNLDKQKIFIYSNLYQSVIVLSFIAIGQKVWPIYTLAFLYSLGDEFFNPAVSVSLPALIPKPLLPSANSLFLFTTQGAIVLGSFIGGIMLKYLANPNWIYLIICATLFTSTSLALCLPTKFLKGIKRFKFINFDNFGQQLKEGYQFIKNEPLVLLPILVLIAIQSLIGMAAIIFPSLAKILKIEFADSSFMIILPAVVGAMTGGAILSHRLEKIRKNVFILGGLYSVGFLLSLLPLISLMFVRPIFIALPLMFFLGLGFIFIHVPLQTLIQEHTPFDIRGRVFGTLSTLINLAVFFPMLITTTIVDLFGIRLMMIFLGVLVLTLAFFSQKNLNKILALGNNQ